MENTIAESARKGRAAASKPAHNSIYAGTVAPPTFTPTGGTYTSLSWCNAASFFRSGIARRFAASNAYAGASASRAASVRETDLMSLEEPSMDATEAVTEVATNPLVAARSRVPLSARPMGELLTLMANVEEAKVDEALVLQAEKGGRIGEILIGMK